MVSLCQRIRAINLLKRMQTNVREKPPKKRRNHDGARTKNPNSWEDFFDEYYEKYKVLLFYLEPYDYSFLALFPFFPCLPSMVSFPFFYSIGDAVGLHECGVISLEPEYAKAGIAMHSYRCCCRERERRTALDKVVPYPTLPQWEGSKGVLIWPCRQLTNRSAELVSFCSLD